MLHCIFILLLHVSLLGKTNGHSTQIWRKFAGKIADLDSCNDGITLLRTSCTGIQDIANPTTECTANMLQCPPLQDMVTRGPLQNSTTPQIVTELGCSKDPQLYRCDRNQQSNDNWAKGDQKQCLLRYCALLCDQDPACVGFNFNNKVIL